MLNVFQLFNLIPLPLQALIITMVSITAILLIRQLWLEQKITRIVSVNKAVFSKLQSIIEFREDLQSNSILNAPVMDEENIVKSIMLTIHKKRKDYFEIVICIKKFELELKAKANAENNTVDKYL